MSSPPQDEEARAVGPPRSYNFVSATYREKEYAGGVLLFDPERKEMELRQTEGKGRKAAETVIARFRVERAAQVVVEGAVLTVSDLSITLEPPEAAGEIGDLIRGPTSAEEERARRISDAESLVRAFLERREEAMGFLSQVKSDPREAVLSKMSMWHDDDTRDPFDAISAGYSKLLADSLERVKTSLLAAEKGQGSTTAERLCALAHTIGAVQDALLEGDSDLSQELAALQELGISTKSQDLRIGKTTYGLISQAFPAREAAASTQSG